MACGAVKALDTMAAAVNLRTPLIGVRVSRRRPWPSPVPRRLEPPRRPGHCGCHRQVAAADEVPDIVPGDQPVRRRCRSQPPGRRPRSLASFRTGGVERGRSAGWRCRGAVSAAGRGAGIDAGSATGVSAGLGDRLSHRAAALRTHRPARSCGRAGPDGRRLRRRRRTPRGWARAWRASACSRRPPPEATRRRRPRPRRTRSACPTSTTVPGCSCRAVITPANGDGSSTTALAVSTSAMIWLRETVSPTPTFQLTISDSVRPSPRSGSLNSLIMVALILPAR